MAASIDEARLDRDSGYCDKLAHLLLSKCGTDADHVELRRAAGRVFPDLARSGAETRVLATIVGRAATLRADEAPRDARDVTDARLEMTPTAPLPYPEAYAEMDDASRATVVAFCERQLASGRDGPAALDKLLRRHGWPYSERTFYVGPWKAARLRSRRRQNDD